MFVRPNGVEGTWAFFNLIFIIHAYFFRTNFIHLKLIKLVLMKKLQMKAL